MNRVSGAVVLWSGAVVFMQRSVVFYGKALRDCEANESLFQPVWASSGSNVHVAPTLSCQFYCHSAGITVFSNVLRRLMLLC